MKVSAQFAQAQLDRARQIIGSSRRKLIGSADLGQVITLTIQGSGNLLTRPDGSMVTIYNVQASTEARAMEAKKALGSATFMEAIAEMEEAEVLAHVNTILNNATVAFTVPVRENSPTFVSGDLVNALVEQYTVKATEDRAGYTAIGINNVRHVKAVAARSASSIFSNWDDVEDITLTDNTDAGAAEAKSQADPFADSNVAPATPAAETTAP